MPGSAESWHGTLDGYNNRGCRCDSCRGAKRQYGKAYAERNADRIRERQRVAARRRRAESPEKHRAAVAAYAARNPEKMSERNAAYRAVHREQLNAQKRALYAADPSRGRETTAAWKAANPEAVKNHNTRGGAVRRMRMTQASVEKVDRLVVWERDNGKCHLCGQSADPDNWHLEHVIPLALGGEHSYANTAVSHPSCNLQKGARQLIARLS